MLRYFNYDIVFQEIPDEITLAINITGCPYRCKGCHSPHLQEPLGEYLSDQVIERLLTEYSGRVTCLCFMGGDAEPSEIERLAEYINSKDINIKIGWYSGRNKLPTDFSLKSFNYIKLGEYRDDMGGLGKRGTNQRLYLIDQQIVSNPEISPDSALKMFKILKMDK
ncbi:MAG: 4Fe-4S cluster-binding domain-containing protein [Bacteroidales bacterium]|nr:4Fe-4S cluster-binding domain-containing protein [Bacteroidales bacterium]